MSAPVRRIVAALAALLVAGSGWLWWDSAQRRAAEAAGTAAAAAAREAVAAMLSYRPQTAEQDLMAAQDLLTGPYRDDYAQLTTTVVIPDAVAKRVSSTVTVPAAAAVSASAGRAVVLAYVNQTVVEGSGPPAYIPSRARVGMERIDGRWLVSGFETI